MTKIVVGVDGSDGSQRALRWALDEAARSDATVEAVHAWKAAGHESGLYSGGVIPAADIEAAAQQLVDDAVAAADPSGSATVERTVLEGGAAPTLIEAGKDADLLVVGSRGIGGFDRLLLGSVSTQVAHHAPCPVVVIPPQA